MTRFIVGSSSLEELQGTFSGKVSELSQNSMEEGQLLMEDNHGGVYIAGLGWC